MLSVWVKAHGPDGFPGTIFFPKNIGALSMRMFFKLLKVFFFTSILHESVNETHIAMVPKFQHPESSVHFRPISLCKFTYKIISKVIVDRLKIIMPLIVSEKHGAL